MPKKTAKGWSVNIGGEAVEVTPDEVRQHSAKLIGRDSVPKNYEPDDLYLVTLAQLKQQNALGEEPRQVGPAVTNAHRGGHGSRGR